MAWCSVKTKMHRNNFSPLLLLYVLLLYGDRMIHMLKYFLTKNEIKVFNTFP